ncbi:MAG: hypothetical protein PHW96_00155 [Candidatus Nanoarchaeia archaeon]|nr:hypothetical protein [Candidatus Nanoarchaeia archaeon]
MSELGFDKNRLKSKTAIKQMTIKTLEILLNAQKSGLEELEEINKILAGFEKIEDYKNRGKKFHVYPGTLSGKSVEYICEFFESYNGPYWFVQEIREDDAVLSENPGLKKKCKLCKGEHPVIADYYLRNSDDALIKEILYLCPKELETVNIAKFERKERF